MKFKFTRSILLLLILAANFCSSVKVDESDGDDSDADSVTDYDESKNIDEVHGSRNDKSKQGTTESGDGKKKDSDNESSDEEDGDGNESEADSNTTLPFAVEGESLRRLQAFILSGVENAIKSSLPMIVRSASETNVSSQCSASFLTLISALRESKLWAFKMLDASGKLPSGVLEGTLADLGSFDQCLELNDKAASSNEIGFTGQFCLLDTRPAFDQNIPFGSPPPPGIKSTDLLWDTSLRLFWATNHLLAFRYGACIPSTCSREDFEQLANFLLEPVGLESVIHSCQSGHEQSLDAIQLGISIAIGTIIILVLTGTLTEYYFLTSGKAVENFESERSIRQFMTRFSLHRNTVKLLESTANLSGSPLRCLDGMRTISIAWIILGHTYFYTDVVHYHHYRRIKQLYLVDDHPALMWLSNFTFSVDTFFHISGVLLIYSSWKKLTASNGKIDIFDFFVHRIWRIWPAYLATIGIAIVLPLIGSGPLWPLSVESTATMCRKSWLYNILFINNFQKADEICLLHTWFLSASMQFHIMGGIILFVMYKSPKAGIALCTIGTLASSILSFSFAFRNQLQTPSVIAYEVFAHETQLNTDDVILIYLNPEYSEDQKILQIYMMPYNHFGSYLSGIIIGYFLVMHADRKISKAMQAILWILSAVIAVVSVCAPYAAYQAMFPSVFETSIYYALARTGGPVTAFLSWSFFNPLSNLSFLAYLVHPILMLFHTGRIRERIYFGHYELINIWVSRLVFSFLLAYFVHVMIEMPFASIESYIFPGKNKKKRVDHQRRMESSSGNRILDQARLPSLSSWSGAVFITPDRQMGKSCCCCNSDDKRRPAKCGVSRRQARESSAQQLFVSGIRADVLPAHNGVTTVSYTKTDSSSS